MRELNLEYRKLGLQKMRKASQKRRAASADDFVMHLLCSSKNAKQASCQAELNPSPHI